MKFLQKRQNEKSFTKSDYVVLSYEQLLQVNGAGGSSSGPTNGTNDSNWTNPESWNVEYNGTKEVIRVHNTDTETCQMAVTYPYTMAETLKSEYKAETGSDFNVSTGSLAAEIYLHADLYQKGIMQNHTDTADCGVGDSERIVYDTYAAVKGWD